MGVSDVTNQQHKLIELTFAACEGRLANAQTMRLEELLRFRPRPAQALFSVRQEIRLESAAGFAPVRHIAPIEPPLPPTLPLFSNLFGWGESLPGMRFLVWMVAGLVGTLIGLPLLTAIVALLGYSNQPAAGRAGRDRRLPLDRSSQGPAARHGPLAGR